MTNSLKEVGLQGIMVITFIYTDIQPKMLNITTMLPWKPTLQRELAIQCYVNFEAGFCLADWPMIDWLAGYFGYFVALFIRSVGQSVSLSVGRSVGLSVDRSVCRSVGRLAGCYKVGGLGSRSLTEADLLTNGRRSLTISSYIKKLNIARLELTSPCWSSYLRMILESFPFSAAILKWVTDGY